MQILINDGMKKEGKIFKGLMIFGYALAFLILLLAHYRKEYSYVNVVIIFIYCVVFGTVGLYGWLYALKYKLEITEEKIVLKTLFKKTEICISDITNYSCKRYRKTVFYQFRLSVDKKIILLNTRYKDELEKLLLNVT